MGWPENWRENFFNGWRSWKTSRWNGLRREVVATFRSSTGWMIVESNFQQATFRIIAQLKDWRMISMIWIHKPRCMMLMDSGIPIVGVELVGCHWEHSRRQTQHEEESVVKSRAKSTVKRMQLMKKRVDHIVSVWKGGRAETKQGKCWIDLWLHFVKSNSRKDRTWWKFREEFDGDRCLVVEESPDQGTSSTCTLTWSVLVRTDSKLLWIELRANSWRIGSGLPLWSCVPADDEHSSALMCLFRHKVFGGASLDE